MSNLPAILTAAASLVGVITVLIRQIQHERTPADQAHPPASSPSSTTPAA